MTRRLKILHVSEWVLVQLLRQDGSKRLQIKGLPADARLVAVSHRADSFCSQFSFEVESEEFPVVQEGAALPVLVVTVTDLDFKPATLNAMPLRVGIGFMPVGESQEADTPTVVE